MPSNVTLPSREEVISTLVSAMEYKTVRFAVGVAAALTLRKVFDILKRKWYRLPPGPIGVPFFGTLFELSHIPSMIEYPKKYGPIHLTYFGFGTVVFINDFKLVDAIYKKNHFNKK